MIKVVETVKPDVPVEYPCLRIGKTTGTVVLFNAHKCGTVIKSVPHNADCGVGDYRQDWIMDTFKPYNGTLTLSNQE